MCVECLLCVRVHTGRECVLGELISDMTDYLEMEKLPTVLMCQLCALRVGRLGIATSID